MFATHLRRRVTALTVLALVVLGASQLVATSSGAGIPVRYTVQPGDTLWSIASAQYGGDPRDAIATIEGANRLASDTVYAGDVLLLPSA